MKGAAVWRFGKLFFGKEANHPAVSAHEIVSQAQGDLICCGQSRAAAWFCICAAQEDYHEPRLTEDLILVIEVFSPAERCKGIASALVGHIKEQAVAAESYQVIAYYAPDNLPSHKLWIKNQFCVTPPDPKLDRHLSSCCALYKCCVSPAHRKKGLSYENHDCGRSP